LWAQQSGILKTMKDTFLPKNTKTYEIKGSQVRRRRNYRKRAEQKKKTKKIRHSAGGSTPDVKSSWPVYGRTHLVVPGNTDEPRKRWRRSR